MTIDPNIFKKALLIILHLPDDFIHSVFYITGFCQLLCFLSLNLRNSFFSPIYEVLKLMRQFYDFIWNLEGFDRGLLCEIHHHIMPSFQLRQTLHQVILATFLQHFPESLCIMAMEPHLLRELIVRNFYSLRFQGHQSPSLL